VQLAAATAQIAPQQQREPDPLQAATSRAHAAFADATRAQLAAAAVRPAPRPFASRGAVAALEAEPVRYGSLYGAAATDACRHCADAGVAPAERSRVHDEIVRMGGVP